MRALHALTAALGTIALASCGAAPDGIALRIVDVFDDATVSGTVDVAPGEPTATRR